MIEEEYEAVFEKFDQDKSGFLEKEEAKLLFKDLCNEKAPQSYVFSEENFVSKFKEWDLDGSGTISKEELKALLIKGVIEIYTAEIANLGV